MKATDRLWYLNKVVFDDQMQSQMLSDVADALQSIRKLIFVV